MAKVLQLPKRQYIGNFPRREKNEALRPREYLTESEIESIIAAIRKGPGRHKLRDQLLVLFSFRHGLRAGEAVRLEWDQIDFERGTVFVRRLKGGLNSTHPLNGDEMRLLRAWKRQQQGASRWVFTAWGGAPLTTWALIHVWKKAGRLAGIAFPIHPHMARHGCGYYLANKAVPTRTIQLYLGHKNLNHTAVYTSLSPAAFEGLFS